jgi:hypothetical protein
MLLPFLSITTILTYLRRRHFYFSWYSLLPNIVDVGDEQWAGVKFTHKWTIIDRSSSSFFVSIKPSHRNISSHSSVKMKLLGYHIFSLDNFLLRCFLANFKILEKTRRRLWNGENGDLNNIVVVVRMEKWWELGSQ